MINDLTIYQAALYLGVPLAERGRMRMSVDQYQRRYGAGMAIKD
jgi:hypothetical protein